MKNKGSKRLALVTACITILLSVIGLVGGTMALFTAETQISDSVLQAGNLSVKLERTALQATYLNDKGILVEGENVVDNPYVDFTNSTANVFGFDADDVIVPGSFYSATMLITNNGSVAFDFEATLSVTDNEEAKKLSEQLIVKLEDMNGNEFTSGTVYTGTQNTCAFKIILQFKDLTNNNAVMNAGAKINVKITCTQKTGL